MLGMSFPTPADLAPRRPAGAPGSRGGQWAPRVNAAPSGGLISAETDETILPIPDLVEPVPDWVVEASEELTGKYRDLWKRLNAKHRSTTYGAAPELAQHSTDEAELAVLAKFMGEGIAVKVAQNPAATAPVLHEIAVGESDFRDPAARKAAIVHENCAEETIRIVHAHRKTLDYQGVGKTSLAEAPNTPVDVLEDLAAEGDELAQQRLEFLRD